MTIPILYMKCLEVKNLVQQATANNQWFWPLNSGPSDSSTAMNHYWLRPEITTAANYVSATIVRTLLIHFIPTITIRGVCISFIPTYGWIN